MTGMEEADQAITAILDAYPTLLPADAAVFLQICAEDGISLKTLSRRLQVGQSVVARHITALEQLGRGREALVEVRAASEDALRRTVHLTDAGHRICSVFAAAD